MIDSLLGGSSDVGCSPAFTANRRASTSEYDSSSARAGAAQSSGGSTSHVTTSTS